MSIKLRLNHPPRGAGGKGGGEARTPVESPNTLRSKQYANILDAVSEGEIVGLVDGLKSIYLNDTPILDGNGNANFSGVSAQWTTGTQWQGAIANLNAVESETPVGVRCKQSDPIVRRLTNPQATAVRVTLSTPQLSDQDMSNGDMRGSRVDFVIELQTNGAGWQVLVQDAFDGKTMSRYQRAYRLGIQPGATNEIRLRRTSPDSEAANIRNELYWDSLTEIIDTRLRYPNTALVALTIDSEHFSNLPSRAYDIKGLIVRVPDNYDPATRAYNGIWSGNFKLAWTDNPVWCFYDLLTSERYGLGYYITQDQVDKWTLYQIAQYCDQYVPDGFGGLEPRYTCNMYIQSRQEAYSVLQQMASIFRAMPWWNNGLLSATQDAPSEPVAQFTRANVLEGGFTYSGAALKARHSVALVRWNDPAERYQLQVEYCEDAEAIARFGVRELEITAAGCTSRGQANRIGRWALLTEKLESETVSFSIGLESAYIWPGAVVELHDPARAEARRGGRILAATTTQITLDAPIDAPAGSVGSLAVTLPDGSIQRHTISTTGSAVIDLPYAIPTPPVEGALWIFTHAADAASLWRVQQIEELDAGLTARVTAVRHVPEKYAAIENGLNLAPRQSWDQQQAATAPGQVSNISISKSVYQISPGVNVLRATVAWDAATNATSYEVQWVSSANTQTFTTTSNSLDIEPISTGTYQVKITAINANGQRGTTVISSATITGQIVGATTARATISATGGQGHILINAGMTGAWLPSDTLEIHAASTTDINTASLVYSIKSSLASYTDAPLAGNTSKTYWARILRADASYSAWSSPATATTEANGEYDDRVRYAQVQSLTDPQQAQARINISAASQAQITALDAAIQTEATARADADDVLQADLSTLVTKLGNVQRDLLAVYTAAKA